MIVSMTEIDNFFELRDHPAAEPHIAELAAKMKVEVDQAKLMFALMERRKLTRWANEEGDSWKYQILSPGNWHMPLVYIREINNWSISVCKKISSARSARTSYTLLETGKLNSVSADVDLCKRLFGGEPKHLSPTEHAAQAQEEDVFFANFRSYKQFRKEIEA